MMKLRPGRMLGAALTLSALLACSEDAELADPGGMGAGRPDTAGSSEAPAESVLRYSRPGAITDTSAVVQDPTGTADPPAAARDTGR